MTQTFATQADTHILHRQLRSGLPLAVGGEGAWLIGADGRRVSTLDLVGKGRFTLVTGIAGHAWVKGAKSLNLPYLDTLVIGAAGAQDVYCDWQAVREIEEAGALLVRPDGVVAWRHFIGVANTNDAWHALEKALTAVLAKSLEIA